MVYLSHLSVIMLVASRLAKAVVQFSRRISGALGHLQGQTRPTRPARVGTRTRGSGHVEAKGLDARKQGR